MQSFPLLLASCDMETKHYYKEGDCQREGSSDDLVLKLPLQQFYFFIFFIFVYFLFYFFIIVYGYVCILTLETVRWLFTFVHGLQFSVGSQEKLSQGGLGGNFSKMQLYFENRQTVVPFYPGGLYCVWTSSNRAFKISTTNQFGFRRRCQYKAICMDI